jgi:hypothetical protein
MTFSRCPWLLRMRLRTRILLSFKGRRGRFTDVIVSSTSQRSKPSILTAITRTILTRNSPTASVLLRCTSFVVNQFSKARNRLPSVLNLQPLSGQFILMSTNHYLCLCIMLFCKNSLQRDEFPVQPVQLYCGSIDPYMSYHMYLLFIS